MAVDGYFPNGWDVKHLKEIQLNILTPRVIKNTRTKYVDDTQSEILETIDCKYVINLVWNTS